MQNCRVVRGSQTEQFSINGGISPAHRLAHLGPVHGSKVCSKGEASSGFDQGFVCEAADGCDCAEENLWFIGKYNPEDGSFNEEDVLIDGGAGNTKVEVYVCNPSEFLPHPELVMIQVLRLLRKPEGGAHRIIFNTYYDGTDGDDDHRGQPAAQRVTFDQNPFEA